MITREITTTAKMLAHNITFQGDLDNGKGSLIILSRWYGEDGESISDVVRSEVSIEELAQREPDKISLLDQKLRELCEIVWQ